MASIIPFGLPCRMTQNFYKNRSRQLHIYRNVKKAASKREQNDACIDSAEREQARRKVKVLVLAGKSAPKVIREDKLIAYLPKSSVGAVRL